jgi:release factor glutamine methyltransferase
MSTYKELLCIGREILSKHEIADADVDAWYLLAHVCKINRTDLLLRGATPVTEEDSIKYKELIEQRAAHIPLQHIIGSQEFMGLEFIVTKDVLIPRQDTEILVEEVLKLSSGKSILDMCTGSGCIIISLAKLGNPIKATGVDISEKALNIAKQNSKLNGVEVEFILSDLFDNLTGEYDIIVSNPPYIPTAEITRLMPEVRIHEPMTALDGYGDGLEFYRKITKQLKNHLVENGFIFYEIGHNQGEDVRIILEKEGFTDVVIKKDLNGHDRVVIAKK